MAAGVQANLQVVNEPVGTEFMTEGGFDWFFGSAWVSAETGQWPWFYYGRDVNLWMERFQNLDWTLIVRLVLSFLCIVLAYDAIAGEVERGTLRLVLACPVSRGHVLLAKFAAALTVLLTAFLLGSLVSMAILTSTADLPLTTGLLSRYLLYGLTTSVYLSLFLLLSLGVSALARSSASALVLLALAWAVANVILPQTSYLVAMRAVEVPQEMGDAPWQYMQQVRETLQQEHAGPRNRETARTDHYAVEQRYARLLGDAEREMYRRGQAGMDREVERYRVARTVNLLSPSYAFQYTVEGLLGTGLAKRQNLLSQAFAYRETLRAFLRDRDAQDGASPHVLFLPPYMG